MFLCFFIENNNADDFFALISHLSCVRAKLCQLVSKLKAWNSEEGDIFERSKAYLFISEKLTILYWRDPTDSYYIDPDTAG